MYTVLFCYQQTLDKKMLLEINSLHIKGSFIFCVVCNYFHLRSSQENLNQSATSTPRDVTKCESFLPSITLYYRTTYAITLYLLFACPLQDTSGTPS